MIFLDGIYNYAESFLTFILILFSIAMPGICWNSYTQRKHRLRSAFLPIPGLILLAATGLLLWLWHPSCPSDATIFLVLMIASTVFATQQWWTNDLKATDLVGDLGEAFAIWLCVALTAMAIGINPLPMAQEINSGTILPGRMVASPPDHAIPFYTAVYFTHGKDGRQNSDDYFGSDWSVTSRGPLAPLAETSLLRIFKATPSDPPDLAVSSWPVDRQGAYVARLFGWLTNSLVVLGVAHLLQVLGVGAWNRRVGTIWAALAPATLINTVFLWPKLLAAFFILLSTATIFEAGWMAAGALAALAWLSHPVGALFIPCLGMMSLWRGARISSAGVFTKARGALIGGSRFVLALVVVMAPWLAYKIWLGRHDVFTQYLFAGGAGLNPAPSFAAWLDFRLSNFDLTLVPGAFFASQYMKAWLFGPLGDPLRWTVQYAKTLPAELSFSLFALAYAAVAWRPANASLRPLKWAGVFGAFATMIVYWGYSDDGLGRNCLEPLVYLVIVMAVATVRVPPVVWRLGLTGTFLEGRWIEFSAFLGADGFDSSGIPLAAWLAWTASTMLQLGLVLWVWRSPRPSMPGPPTGFNHILSIPRQNTRQGLSFAHQKIRQGTRAP